MVEFWMQKIASYDGQEYVLVDEDTMARLNAFGLGGREVYTHRLTWNYVKRMSSDEKAITNLKKLLAEMDKRPLIIKLTAVAMKDSSGKKSYPSKNFSKENFFNGTNWYGVLIEDGDAWIVYCYTRDLNLS